MKVYTIAKDLVSLLEEKVNKFVTKFGNYVDCTFSVGEAYRCEDENSPWYRCMLVDVELDAKYKLGEFEFVCSLEWNDEAQENLIKKASEDISVPSEYRLLNTCDHCKTHRRRKSTIVLRNLVTGDYVQVGKSCVKEYVGIDLGHYASYLSFFQDMEDYLESCKQDKSIRYRHYYEVDEVLLQTLEEVQRHGYISKQQSYELDTDSTASRVFKALTKFVEWGEHEPRYKMYEVTEYSRVKLAELKKFYAEELEENDLTDYIQNIQTLLKTTSVDPDNLGLLVSAIGCKLRIENQRKSKQERKESKFVGSVGDRISFRAVPKCVFSSENEYGYYYIYNMNVDGDEIVWKTSKYLNTECEYEFTATVKSQEEYRGVKQTEVTRARVK